MASGRRAVPFSAREAACRAHSRVVPCPKGRADTDVSLLWSSAREPWGTRVQPWVSGCSPGWEDSLEAFAADAVWLERAGHAYGLTNVEQRHLSQPSSWSGRMGQVAVAAPAVPPEAGSLASGGSGQKPSESKDSGFTLRVTAGARWEPPRTGTCPSSREDRTPCSSAFQRFRAVVFPRRKSRGRCLACRT